MLGSPVITPTRKQILFLLLLSENGALSFSDQKDILIKNRQNFLRLIKPLKKAGYIIGTSRRIKSKYITTFWELTAEGISLIKLLKLFTQTNE